jgi:DNA-binding IclR family transcriptional regulator
LHASALGKVLLAYRAAGPVPELETFTRKTVVTAKDLAATLDQVREAGWASEVEELTLGEAAIAAPIRGYGGLVVGAIGVSGLVERICDRRYRPHPHLVTYVRDAARAVSRDLGAARR